MSLTKIRVSVEHQQAFNRPEWQGFTAAFRDAPAWQRVGSYKLGKGATPEQAVASLLTDTPWQRADVEVQTWVCPQCGAQIKHVNGCKPSGV